MPGPEQPVETPEPGTPRWVKVLGIVVLALVLLLLAVRLTGVAGDHGPGRHVGAHTEP